MTSIELVQEIAAKNSGFAMKIRLYTHKSRRHYGGREITTTAHIVRASFVRVQADGSILTELLEAAAGHPKGHKIAVWSNDIIEK